MDLRILVFSVFGEVIGVILLYFGYVSFRTKKLIENTPTSKIRSIAMGFVEVYGMIVPYEKKILQGPFSQKDCVYYKYEVEKYVKNSKGGGRWKTISKGSSGVPFELKDATGLVLVDPNGAEVDAPETAFLKSRFGVDPPKHVQNFLEKNGISFEGLLGMNKEMRYKEYAIFPKQNVYIMGTAGDNPYVAEGKMQKNSEDVMIQKGKEVFYISPKSEKEVLQSFNKKILLGLVLGAILFLLGLIGIFLYFNIL